MHTKNFNLNECIMLHKRNINYYIKVRFVKAWQVHTQQGTRKTF